jgi:hypothetical protein
MKKRLLVIAMVLALVMTGALVALAVSTEGDIYFTDTRGGVIDIDPDDCGDCGDCDICDVDPDWPGWFRGRGTGLDFWAHDLADVQNNVAAGAEVEFNTRRFHNAWDPNAGSGEESFTGLFVASRGQNQNIQVRMGGFFNGAEWMLQGHEMELTKHDWLESSLGVGSAFDANVTGLMPGVNGALGPVQDVTVSPMPSGEAVAVLYEATMAVPRGQVLASPLGEATAEIVWAIVQAP